MYLHPSAELETAPSTHSSLVSTLSKFDQLTKQEMRVVNFLAEGLVPKDIAEATDTKVSTVRSHLKNIRRKLDAHSNIRAIHVARKYGLLNEAWRP
jgi:LuxR family transcriptional regulator, maltose regulon positive regulatory protein